MEALTRLEHRSPEQIIEANVRQFCLQQKLSLDAGEELVRQNLLIARNHRAQDVITFCAVTSEVDHVAFWVKRYDDGGVALAREQHAIQTQQQLLDYDSSEAVGRSIQRIERMAVQSIRRASSVQSLTTVTLAASAQETFHRVSGDIYHDLAGCVNFVITPPELLSWCRREPGWHDADDARLPGALTLAGHLDDGEISVYLAEPGLLTPDRLLSGYRCPIPGTSPGILYASLLHIYPSREKLHQEDTGLRAHEDWSFVQPKFYRMIEVKAL